VSLNGPTTVTGANAFSTGSGAVTLNGNTTLSANMNFTQNGTGTFTTGSGAVTVNGAATFLAGPVTFGSAAGVPVHIVSKQTTKPTAARSGNGAGATGVCSIVSGTDTAGILQVVTGGAGEATSTAMCTVTFNVAYGVAPVVVMTLATAPAATEGAAIETFVSATATTTFSVSSGALALADVTTYQWYYVVIGK
jgi:hypothetical protein